MRRVANSPIEIPLENSAKEFPKWGLTMSVDHGKIEASARNTGSDKPKKSTGLEHTMIAQLRATSLSTLAFAVGLMFLVLALFAGSAIGQQASAAPAPIEIETVALTISSSGFGDLP